MKKLSDWAKTNGVSYNKAYRNFQKGAIPGARKLENGSIIIEQESPKETNLLKKVYNESEITTVASVGGAEISTASVRRNSISTMVSPLDEYANIEGGILPYSYVDGAGNSSNYISIAEIVTLCNKAYFNFSVVRNIIELMVEFSTADIYFTGGTKKARDFWSALIKKIGVKAFSKEFFREFFRSGNPFIFRYDVEARPEDIGKLNQVYGITAAKKLLLPARYILLNPREIQLESGVMFHDGKYVKVLNDYEKECLRNPRTEEDKEIFNNLPPEAQKAIKSKQNIRISIDLPMDKVYFVPFAKQSYEPFGVSVIFPVLRDIEWKAQMKKVDAAIARTVQQAVLLITTGTEPEKGGINPKNIAALQTIFENESVGRVLISDYTTKAQFVIPEIADILDPKKYEVINQDIKDGLNNILLGSGNSEKFANKSVALNVFMERLKAAREVFIEQFLQPEIRRISEELGFKSYPEAKFTEYNLKDDVEYSKLFARLCELGVLTPDETITAIETGLLPSKEESLQNQEEFRGNKEKGYYAPIVGGGIKDQKDLAKMSNDAKMQQKQLKVSNKGGRPSGTGKPQKSNRKSTPMGASMDGYSLAKIKENMVLAQDLAAEMEKSLLKHFKIKSLSSEQKALADELSEVIMANESPENWKKSVKDYISNPLDKNKEQVDKILDIGLNHEVNTYIATLLYHSKKEVNAG